MIQIAPLIFNTFLPSPSGSVPIYLPFSSLAQYIRYSFRDIWIILNSWFFARFELPNNDTRRSLDVVLGIRSIGLEGG